MTDSDSLYFQVMNTAADALVVVNKCGNIVLVNMQAEHLFGFSRDELLGKTLEMLIPPRYRGAHGSHVARYFDRANTRPMGSGLELFALKKDGSEVAIEVGLSPMQVNGEVLVSASLRDITRRKSLEADARLNADRLERAVETIREAIALYDPEQRVVLCNTAFRRFMASLGVENLVGRTREEMLALIMDKIATSTDAERVSFVREREVEWSQPTAARDVRYVDGRVMRVISQRTSDGGVVQTMLDLTQDAQREEALRVAHAAADEASRAKSDFLASMSHELRTPLNAILGFAQLLQRDRKEPLSQRHKDRVDHILKGGEHLLHLINDILDLSRIEAGSISISAEPVAVGELLEVVKTTLEPVALRAGIKLVVADIPGSPLVIVDRTRFAQILVNLGSNAIKYNRPGGKVTVVVSTPSAGIVRVSVIDTGFGIPKNKVATLFQPFQRAGQETGPIEGTGIGLVITKRLAELMRGSVGFKTEEGVGSEFWVDVPVESPHDPPLPPMRARVPSRASFDEAARRVLYVEDNPANIVFMKALLQSLDHVELICAPTAENGLEIARTQPLDVILMDIHLPGASGLDAMRALATDERTKRVPVIALTAAASEQNQKEGLDAGFFRYLTKPVKIDELESALARAFEKSDRAFSS